MHRVAERARLFTPCTELPDQTGRNPNSSQVICPDRYTCELGYSSASARVKLSVRAGLDALAEVAYIPGEKRMPNPTICVAVFVMCALTVYATAAVAQDTESIAGEWRVYGSDKAGSKYSSLDQIERDNFAELELVWRWRSVDGFLSKSTANGGEWWSSRDSVVERLERETPDLYRSQNSPNYTNLQATPLMIGGVLYLNTPLSQGAAVDARTGRTLWVFNPKSYEEGTTAMTVTWRQRGVAYWTDGTEERQVISLCSEACSKRSPIPSDRLLTHPGFPR